MKQVWMWTSLLAGGMLLSGCGAAANAQAEQSQANDSPITLIQATPPEGYEFVQPPQTKQGRLTFRDGQAISELPMIQVRPQTPRLSLAQATDGSIARY